MNRMTFSFKRFSLSMNREVVGHGALRRDSARHRRVRVSHRAAPQGAGSDVVPRAFRPLCAGGDGATRRPPPSFQFIAPMRPIISPPSPRYGAAN